MDIKGVEIILFFERNYTLNFKKKRDYREAFKSLLRGLFSELLFLPKIPRKTTWLSFFNLFWWFFFFFAFAKAITTY
jgi:hypothetical protein